MRHSNAGSMLALLLCNRIGCWVRCFLGRGRSARCGGHLKRAPISGEDMSGGAAQLFGYDPSVKQLPRPRYPAEQVVGTGSRGKPLSPRAGRGRSVLKPSIPGAS
jgi:hypothetical protein